MKSAIVFCCYVLIISVVGLVEYVPVQMQVHDANAIPELSSSEILRYWWLIKGIW